MIGSGSSIVRIGPLESARTTFVCLCFSIRPSADESYWRPSSISAPPPLSLYSPLKYLSCVNLERREAGQHREENNSARPHVGGLSIVLGPFHHLRKAKHADGKKTVVINKLLYQANRSGEEGTDSSRGLMLRYAHLNIPDYHSMVYKDELTPSDGMPSSHTLKGNSSTLVFGVGRPRSPGPPIGYCKLSPSLTLARRRQRFLPLPGQKVNLLGRIFPKRWHHSHLWCRILQSSSVRGVRKVIRISYHRIPQACSAEAR